MPLPIPHQIADFRQLTSDLDLLKDDARWIRWRYAPKRNNPSESTKLPLSRHGSKYGSPEHWMSFTEAAGRVPRHGGLGLVQTPNYDIGFIDLDDCYDGNAVSPWAVPIVQAAYAAGLYLEPTVSGHGIRIIGATSRVENYTRTRKGLGRSKAGYECYACTTRFITISGLGAGDPLADIDPIFGLIEQLYPPDVPNPVSPVLITGGDWRVIPSRKPKPIEPELMARITSLSPHDAGDRSRAFHGVVSALFDLNFSSAEIVSLLEQHPDGVAQRFIVEGRDRLPRMVELSFGKLRVAFEQKRARFEYLLRRR
jgi:hypothetical protein